MGFKQIGNFGAGGAAGDMTKAVYDPTNVAADAFDADNTVYDPSGDIVATDVQSAITELDTEKISGLSIALTGLVSGGELTVNAGDATLLDVSAAVYYIQGIRYTYAGATGIGNGLGVSDTARRYALDATGLVSQAGSYSDAQKQTVLPISRIQATQGTSGSTATIIPPIDKRYFISEQGYLERIWQEQVFGALYSETGGDISESSTPLQVDQDAGTFFDAQGKKVTVSSATDVTAKYVYHVAGVYAVQTEATLVVNTTQYDDGTDLATMTDTFWTTHTILKSPKAGNEFFVVLGDAEYATQTEAEASATNYGPFVNEASSGLIAVAKFVTRKGATSINRIVSLIPRIKAPAQQTTGISALLPTVSSPSELVNYEDAWRNFNTGAVVAGCDITDNLNGTLSIASGEVALRSANTDNAPLTVYAIAASGTLTPADGDVTYYYVDYNGGSPVWASGTDIFSYNGTDKMQAYTVGRRGTSIWSVDARKQSVDGNRKSRRRDLEWDGSVQNGYWHASGGSVTTASGLSPIVSAGTFYYGLAPIAHIGFDTTIAGTANANVFDYYYNRGAYTYTADSKTLSNTQYDNAGVLTSMSPNRYRTDWVYLVLGESAPRLVAIYGDTQTTTLAAAQAESTPSTIPAFMDGVGVLVAQAVAQEGTTTLIVETAFGSVFTPAASGSDHTLLSNLGWTASGHTDGVDSLAGFDGTGAAAAYTTSGTGTEVALTTSPTLVTPALGTPASGVMTNVTGTASGLTAGGNLVDVLDDTTPQLGGNLDATDKNISGLGSVGFTQELDNGSKTASFTVDFSTDQKQKATLTANTITLTLDTTDIKVGNYILKIVNGGLATLTWAAETGSVLWPGGTAPTLTSSGTDIVAIYFDGTDFYGQSSLAFA